MIKPNRRLFRYSFIKFVCVLGVFWILFLLYVSTWNTDFLNDVNQNFVAQVFKGKLKGVIEKNLKQEAIDVDEENRNKLNYNQLKSMDEVSDDIFEENDEEVVYMETEQRSLSLRESIPVPMLPHDILQLHARMNFINPGHNGAAVVLPAILEPDIERMLNKSREKYQINEFVSSLVPLDRELPDIRTDYCRNMKYSENLPMASIIIVFHNEAMSMILRTIYSIYNRSPQHLVGEIIIVDDCSDIGNKHFPNSSALFLFDLSFLQCLCIFQKTSRSH